MSKKNLKNITMAFAVAANLAPTDPIADVKNIVTKKVNKLTESKATNATKAAKPSVGRDPNSLLSNNFRKFSVVGTTMLKGTQKIWFANETAVKVKNMIKQGHTDVNYVSLPQPMTKTDALAYLKANPTLVSADLVDEKSTRLTTVLKSQAHKG